MTFNPTELTVRQHLAVVGLLIAFSLAVIVALSMTIHKHDLASAKFAEYRARMANDGERWDKTIRRWVERGFVHEGGMKLWEVEWVNNWYSHALPNTKLPPDTVYPWRNSTMSWIVPAFVLQKINVSLRGDYSLSLMLAYNQLAIAFPAVAVGYLCVLMALGLGQRPAQALALGAACQLLFQTHPLSLWSYFETQPLSILLGFAAAFLCHEYWLRGAAATGWRSTILTTFLATMTLVAEPITGGSFLASYLLIRTILDERAPGPSQWLAILIAPAVITVLYLLWQQAMVRLNYESVVFVGSLLVHRMGLDGDTRYYADQLDILLRRLPPTPWLGELLDWRYLNFIGLIGTAAVIGYYREIPGLRLPAKLVLAAFGLYVPVAIFCSQLVFIHPYYWNLALLIPFLVAGFCLVPALINLGNRLGGLPVLCAAVLALFYAAYHVRIYSTVFPVVR